MDTDDEEIIHVNGSSVVFTGTRAEEAKAFVQQHLQDGVTCPTCGQFCKVDR